MEVASIIVAVLSAIFSIVTYITAVRFEKKKITIEAINLLQNEVLDKFVSVRKENAKIIVENLDNKECKKAYNDYRALIARLEHFAIGVNEHIYNYNIVNALLGKHFICLYVKVVPIIDEANKKENHTVYYYNFEKLVKRLNFRHKIIKQEEDK